MNDLTAFEVSEVQRIQADARKRDAFYQCYPMIKHVDDPLYRPVWDTFSHIWELAIRSKEMK